MKQAKMVAYLPGLTGWLQHYGEPTFSHYQKWLKAANILPNDYANIYELLLKRESAAASIAEMTALAEGLEDGYWLRADPVSFQVDIGQVYQLGSRELNLSQKECHQLLKQVRPLFEQLELKLVAPSTKRWYVRCQKQPRIITTDPESIRGNSIAGYLPLGEERNFWLRLFTEIQMILFESEVNEKRRSAGQPTIDALWFWGAGKKFTGATQLIDTAGIISSHPFLRQVLETFAVNTVSIESWVEQPCYNLGQDKPWVFYSEYFDCLPQKTILPIFWRAIIGKKFKSLSLYPDNKHCYYMRSKQALIWSKLFKK